MSFLHTTLIFLADETSINVFRDHNKNYDYKGDEEPVGHKNDYTPASWPKADSA
jgi:hypothetical protein